MSIKWKKSTSFNDLWCPKYTNLNGLLFKNVVWDIFLISNSLAAVISNVQVRRELALKLGYSLPQMGPRAPHNLLNFSLEESNSAKHIYNDSFAVWRSYSKTEAFARNACQQTCAVHCEISLMQFYLVCFHLEFCKFLRALGPIC